LTEGGHAALTVAEKAKMRGFRRGMSEAMIDHEIKVNGVGLVLTQLLGLSVTTERQLAELNTRSARPEKGQEAFPDLWIVDKEHPKAVEVELTQKSELRYKEIFYRYSQMVGYGGMVLYLTGWPNGPDLLWKLAKKWDRPFIYVASIQQFRRTSGRCPFTNCEGRSLILAPAQPASKPELETVGGIA
jgi:hypothetical protein